MPTLARMLGPAQPPAWSPGRHRCPQTPHRPRLRLTRSVASDRARGLLVPRSLRAHGPCGLRGRPQGRPAIGLRGEQRRPRWLRPGRNRGGRAAPASGCPPGPGGRGRGRGRRGGGGGGGISPRGRGALGFGPSPLWRQGERGCATAVAARSVVANGDRR